MDHASALVEQNQMLGELLRSAELTTPVPTCPGWTLEKLLRHVGRGDRWAAQIIDERTLDPVDPRSVADGKPPGAIDDAISWLHASARAVVNAAAEAGPDTEVWTFLGPRPAPWWVRRRLHEATIHRADAALALGMPYELTATLAADGISEWLDRLAAEQSSGRARSLDDGAVLHLHATDDGLGSDGEWTVRGSDSGITWQHGHDRGDTALRGRAVDLLLALVRRRTSEEAGVELIGDPDTWSAWLERTPL